MFPPAQPNKRRDTHRADARLNSRFRALIPGYSASTRTRRGADVNTNTKTVETGTARCPRCMVHTEYRFLDRGDDTLLYEVDCTACGHVYSEVTGAAAPAA